MTVSAAGDSPVEGYYAVGEVAALAHVTVRTLHHYDEIDLVSPSRRTAAGHRRYTEADLRRLQGVLYYRELGFPLEQVAALLDDPSLDTAAHLRNQHQLLTDRIERLRAVANAVTRALEAHEMGDSLTPEERFEVFGEFDVDRYGDEARERWGEADAYRESRRRTARYSPVDWKRITEEGERLDQRFAAARRAGEPADGGLAAGIAEDHRLYLSRWFYECGHELHRGLGDMYLADERFRSRYEQIAPGLAQYLRDAIHANGSADIPAE